MDNRIIGLQSFLVELLESIEVYINRKKELLLNGKIESEDYFEKVSRSFKDTQQAITMMEKTISEIEKTNAQNQLQSQNSPKQIQLEKDSKNQALQGIMNLKKTLTISTPFEISKDDEFSTSRTSDMRGQRDQKKDHSDLVQANESMRYEINHLKEELLLKDSKKRHNCREYEGTAKTVRFDEQSSGLEVPRVCARSRGEDRNL